MGCNLHVQVFVNDHNSEKSDEIVAELVPYPFANLDEGTMSADGEVGFYGGRSPQTFTTDITHAIWKANGGYCNVVVRVDEPMEYSLTDEDYARFAADQPEGWEFEEDEEEMLA
jgi:hypothetical protein